MPQVGGRFRPGTPEYKAAVKTPKIKQAKPKPAPKTPNVFQQKLGAPDLGEQKAARRTVRAKLRLPGTPKLAVLPQLSHPTGTQRKAAVEIQQPKLTAIRQQLGLDNNGDTMEQVRKLGTNQQRKAVQTLDRSLSSGPSAATQTARYLRKGGLHGSKRALDTFSDAWKAAHPNSAATVPPKAPHEKHTGFAHLAGVPIPRLIPSTAEDVLKQLARPVHGLAGAALAEKEGRNPAKAFVRGIENKDKTTFGDVIKAGGSSPAVSLIGGLAGDIFLDPTTYATFGATAPKTLLENGARTASRLAEEAHAAGDTAKAMKLAERAHDMLGKAAEASDRRGLQVGFSVKGAPRRGGFDTRVTKKVTVPGTPGLAKLSRAKEIHESRAVQAFGRAFNPEHRPPEVDEQTWRQYLHSRTFQKASARTGAREGERIAQRLNRELKSDGDHRLVISALEGVRGIEDLPARLQPVAKEARHLLNSIADRETRSGILDTFLSDYVPHQFVEDIEGAKGAKRLTAAFRPSIKKNVYAKARESTKGKPLEQIRDELNPGQRMPFSENLGGLVGKRHANSEDLLALHQHLKQTATALGTELKTPADLAKVRNFDALYRVDRHGLHEIKTDAGRPDLHKAQELLSENADGVVSHRIVALPRVLGEQETKVRTAGGHVEGLGKGWDKFMAGLKSTLTVLNVPAYDLRNLTGDLHNAYLADTRAADIAQSGKLLRHKAAAASAERKLGRNYDSNATLQIRGKTVKVGDFLHDAERNGAISTGFVGAEKFDVAHSTKTGTGFTLPRLVKGHRLHPVESLRNVGQYREDLVRLGTYLSALKRGMSPEDAVAWVNKHHFDYGELTEPERQVMRRIFPFYTFTARNTKLQTEKLFTRPGKYATYSKVQEEAAHRAGLPDDYEEQLQKYQRRGLPIAIKVHGQVKLLYPSLPLVDVNRTMALLGGDIPEEWQLTAQNINPAIKAPVELLTNHSFFFRQPIYRDQQNTQAKHWVPAPTGGPFAALFKIPAFRKAVGARTIEGPDGKPTLGWTAKADYIARQLPQTNFAIQAFTPTTGSRNQTAGDTIVSQLTGVKVGEYNPDQLRLSAVYTQLQQLEVRKNDLQDTKRAYSKHTSTGYTREYSKVLKQSRELTKEKLALRAKLKLAPPHKKSTPAGQFDFPSVEPGASGFDYGPTSSGSSSSQFDFH